jgi:hypothetical protein
MVGGYRNEDHEEQPTWLNTENDDQHRAEITPLLFGAGPVNLADHQEEEMDEDDDDDVQQQHGDNKYNELEDESDLETAVLSAASGTSKKMYGSTTSSPTSKSPKSTGSSSSSKMWSKAKNHLWLFQPKKTTTTTTPTTTPTAKKSHGHPRFQETDDDEASPWSKSQITYSEKTGRPDRPHRSCCLDMFYFVEAYAILTCLGLLVSQTLPLTLVPLKETEPVDVVLKIYISVFSILFMVCSLMQQYCQKTNIICVPHLFPNNIIHINHYLPCYLWSADCGI